MPPRPRRGKPVAICRLKRVAADYKGEIDKFMPDMPAQKNGKRIALIGAGPARLLLRETSCRSAIPLRCSKKDGKPGGLMRTNIPRSACPSVLDEETGRILDFGVERRFGVEFKSMKALLAEGFDAIFVGTGAPKGKDLDIPGARKAQQTSTRHRLADFGCLRTTSRASASACPSIGGGNTAMDCCRTAVRLGGEKVTVTVRSPRRVMKASPWEIEDAEHEDIPRSWTTTRPRPS